MINNINIIILLIIIIFLFYINSFEKFTVQECTFLSKNKCKSYGHHCGWSVTDTGNGNCIPGDAFGPYNNKKTDNWWYNNHCIYGNECRNGDVSRMRGIKYTDRTWDNNNINNCNDKEPLYVKNYTINKENISENIFNWSNNGAKGELILKKIYDQNTLYNYDKPLYHNNCKLE